SRRTGRSRSPTRRGGSSTIRTSCARTSVDEASSGAVLPPVPGPPPTAPRGSVDGDRGLTAPAGQWTRLRRVNGRVLLPDAPRQGEKVPHDSEGPPPRAAGQRLQRAGKSAHGLRG